MRAARPGSPHDDERAAARTRRDDGVLAVVGLRRVGDEGHGATEPGHRGPPPALAPAALRAPLAGTRSTRVRHVHPQHAVM
ncbi:hypothetical protein GCM10027519_33160 [Kineococcus endophyticus]